MTTFLIEAVVLCALFHLEVWLQTKREPARIVYSYPPAIVERYIAWHVIPLVIIAVLAEVVRAAFKYNWIGDVIATIIMTFSSFGYYGQIWFNRAYTYECAVEEMPAGYADGLMAVSPFWAPPLLLLSELSFRF